MKWQALFSWEKETTFSCVYLVKNFKSKSNITVGINRSQISVDSLKLTTYLCEKIKLGKLFLGDSLNEMASLIFLGKRNYFFVCLFSQEF